MCEPVSVAMGVMGVAQAATGARAAGKAAQAQGKANAAMADYRNEMTIRAVNYQRELSDWQTNNYNIAAASEQDSLTGQYAAVLEQIDQVRDQAVEDVYRYSTASQNAAATVRTSALEAGTTGNSVLIAQQQYEAEEARATYLSFKNVANQVRQSERQMLAMQSQSQSRINAAMPAPMQPIDPAQPVQQVQSPSMLPYLVQGGSAIVGAAAHYQSIQATLNAGTGTGTGDMYGPPAPITPVNTNPIISTGGFA